MCDSDIWTLDIHPTLIWPINFHVDAYGHIDLNVRIRRDIYFFTSLIRLASH